MHLKLITMILIGINKNNTILTQKHQSVLSYIILLYVPKPSLKCEILKDFVSITVVKVVSCTFPNKLAFDVFMLFFLLFHYCRGNTTLHPASKHTIYLTMSSYFNPLKINVVLDSSID